MHGKPDVPNGSICMDCQQNTSELHEFYMLHDVVWLRAVPDRLGMLCIGCVEARLGRMLRPGDFDRDWMWRFDGLQSDRLYRRTQGRADGFTRIP